MNKPITTGYVEGYNDATKNIHASIKDAIVRSGVNKQKAIDVIITNMYAQNTDLSDLRTALDEQLSTADDMFSDVESTVENGGTL